MADDAPLAVLPSMRAEMGWWMRKGTSDCVGKAWLIYNSSIERHRTLTKPAPSRGPEEASSQSMAISR